MELLPFLLLAQTLTFAFLAGLFWSRCRRLSAQLKDKQDLISIASHELATPLTHLKGTLSLVLGEATASTRLPESTPARRSGGDKTPGVSLSSQTIDFVRRSLVSVEQQIKLIDDLLTVSRFERGKIEINLKECRIEEIADDVVKQFMDEADKDGLELSLKVSDPPPPKVRLDPDRIREVLVNLVGNALKYTAKGYVRISIGTVPLDSRSLGPRLRESRPSVVVAVSDTGPGIKGPDQKLIFDRFVRLASTKSGHKGAGLGLYISRLIIEAHKGKIWVESELGCGSTFYFSLPVV